MSRRCVSLNLVSALLMKTKLRWCQFHSEKNFTNLSLIKSDTSRRGHSSAATSPCLSAGSNLYCSFINKIWLRLKIPRMIMISLVLSFILSFDQHYSTFCECGLCSKYCTPDFRLDGKQIGDFCDTCVQELIRVYLPEMIIKVSISSTNVYDCYVKCRKS